MADKTIRIAPYMLERADSGEPVLAISPCVCGSPCGSVVLAVLNSSIVAVEGSDKLAVVFKIPGVGLPGVIKALLRHSAEASGGEQ
ncbi:MAG: hypothetical protein K0Q71_2137 [Thermomicrobiales bacterium]|jgi:hypothetical protein|nr:hypothetical protein [Thermomicrobiales bacterium]